MKKKPVIMALTVGVMAACISPAFAEEKMENPETYQEKLKTDLDGDGEKEEIFYISSENEFPAYLEIYEDERLIYDTWSEADAGIWYVDVIQDENGRDYLWAKSVGDNDFCSNVILLEYTQERKLREVYDFRNLFISDWDGEEMNLSDWLNLRVIFSIDKSMIQAGGIINTKRAGALWDVEITCEWGQDGVSADKKMRPIISEEKERTASRDFTLYREPGSKEEALTVKKGDMVRFLSVTWKDETLYLECENASGEKGWIKDRRQDDWNWSPEDGYFEENRYL